ncbi:MAG: 50S ribosomal protein L15e [Candidatus Diapherotrites archaeon]|nr:50S ribosomal protein L15e [Candidatus Diapherotrites archaeon]
MGATKYIKQAFRNEFMGEKDANYDYSKIQRDRMIGFRREKKAVVRIEKPTNIPRARSLGYKAKKGFIVARVRIRKGGGMHPRPRSGRRPRRMGVNKLTRKKGIQAIAEERVGRHFQNCEVLNSYFVGEDGVGHYFEVILVNPHAPEIIADPEINWICAKQHKGRAERGLTSQGKKGRGLRKKGIGTERARPSIRAKGRLAK